MFAQKLAIIVVFSLSICAAQTTPSKPSEPEAIGVFFYLDSGSQTLKRLPSEDYKKHRGGAFSITDNVKVSGTASSLRIAATDKTTFIFKVFKDEEAGKARLFQFVVKGDGREYELGKWKRRDFTPNRGLTVDVAKFGEFSYQLTPEASLEPGEYALTMGSMLFTFGVSASGK